MAKDAGALLTIGELSAQLGVAPHILRYWETRFAALKPLQRAGNRRYYRPAEVALAQRIHQLLHVEGFTIDGAIRALSQTGAPDTLPAEQPANLRRATPNASVPIAPTAASIRAVRDRLARALAAA